MNHTTTETALVSIHDVMPETLARVRNIIRFLEFRGVHRMTLLVVPGKDWTPAQIYELFRFQQKGLELAGHGWKHRVHRIRGIRHRLHGKVISRNEAEHLSLSEAEITAIMHRCYGWFITAGLSAPSLYVPPAWAMGRLRRGCWHTLPFDLYEAQSGLYEAASGRHYPLPVLGYMADTRLRLVSLKLLNIANRRLPLAPTRIAIHPNDLYLPLQADLARHLQHFRRFATYGEIIADILARRAPKIFSGQPASDFIEQENPATPTRSECLP